VTVASATSPAWARTAMVATSNRLAVEAALWALSEGGSAVDAAVAADAVLGVVQPHSTGIGGDAFALVAEPGTTTADELVVGFNGSGPAPAALTLQQCLAPDAWSERSPLTVTVPGVVDAWEQLVARYGRLDLATTLQPAVELAEHGFPIGRIAAMEWSSASEQLHPGHEFPEHPVPGQRITRPALAGSLRAIARGGRDAHMTGAWGIAAVDAVQRAGGCLALDDLAQHRGEWVAPIAGEYHQHEVLQLPPNGQGVAVLAALARLASAPVSSPDDPADVVAVADAIRAGMEDAHAHVADPRVSAVTPFWESAGRDTVYTAVVADGMAVSLITSVYVGFGSGIHAGGAPLQNRGHGFSLDATHPNVVAGGKRPFHTIIPGMVRRDGRVHLVYGLVGGPMQPQGHVQVLRHLLDHGLDPQAALDRPRTFWPLTDVLGIEPGFADDAAVRRAATDAGWNVVDIDTRWFGAGQVIRVHPDGWLEGGSDPRHDGTAFGR